MCLCLLISFPRFIWRFTSICRIHAERESNSYTKFSCSNIVLQVTVLLYHIVYINLLTRTQSLICKSTHHSDTFSGWANQKNNDVHSAEHDKKNKHVKNIFFLHQNGIIVQWVTNWQTRLRKLKIKHKLNYRSFSCAKQISKSLLYVRLNGTKEVKQEFHEARKSAWKKHKEILATAQKNTHNKTKQIGIVRMVS